ncbi:MAG: hypothetical protein KDK40_02570, partial [Chlamydiia bacterium]|nr:hypothetical protein [Chlamydiia bacterium]
MKWCLTLLLVLLIPTSLRPESASPPAITVDLRNPEYSKGYLWTGEGGVVTAPDIRLQGHHILIHRYGKSSLETRVEASEEIMIEYGNYLITGRYIEYDFASRTGHILMARSGFNPWFFGAKRIDLLPDQTLLLTEGYLTTSPSEHPDWVLAIDRSTLNEDLDFDARNPRLIVQGVPVLWLPRFKSNLHTIIDSPLRYRIRWSAKKGLRVTLSYNWIDREALKARVRFDYRLSRGPGLGFETLMRSPGHCETFRTVNYIARDSSLLEPERRLRYRFRGNYWRSQCDGNLTFELSYDRISDKEMPSDYCGRGLDLNTAGRTRFRTHYRTPHLQFDALALYRINDFETATDLLPLVSLQLRPIAIAQTGLLTYNRFQASYNVLNYADELAQKGYHSLRLSYRHTVSHTLSLGPLLQQSTAEFISIYYSDRPDNENEDKNENSGIGLTALKTATESSLTANRCFDCNLTHSLTPYLSFENIAAPTYKREKHYYFGIQDSWNPVRLVKLGLRQILSRRDPLCGIRRILWGDLYAIHFFGNFSQVQDIPRIYTDLFVQPIPTWNQSIKVVWSTKHQALEDVRIRTEWTASADFALAAEFRTRSPFAWRKVDPNNFIL